MQGARDSLEDEVRSVLSTLKRQSTKRTRDGMARYGIPADNALESFAEGLRFIERAASDERHYIKKSVNMALCAIGKRNRALNAASVAVARRLAEASEPAARWVGKDALRALDRK